MKNKMKCFISLPIAGKEDTVFERANHAKEEVIKLGFIPVSPLDLNEINNENIDGHGDRVAFYMGKDIETLINCDAIYSCDGWEYSKGCQVERKCAEVYGKIIINQKKDLFAEKIENKFKELINEYHDVCENYRMNDINVIKAKNNLESFKNDMNKWFGYEW